MCSNNNSAISRLGKCNCNELRTNKSGEVYLKKNALLFSGICIVYNTNSTLHLTKEFKNGKLHGKMIRYKPNGKKLSVVEFQENLIHGRAVVLDMNGKDSILQHYKNGVLLRN